MPQPISRTYVSQRLHLNYVDWGNDGAPPLLLIHGGRDHARSWDWVARALCGDFHVLAPDLRGHGDSQWTSSGAYGVNEFVYDMAELIHQLNLAPLAIVGHSLGGAVALRYGGIFPETVSHLLPIEGLGRRPRHATRWTDLHPHDMYRSWVEMTRDMSARKPRRYPTIEDAIARMHTSHPHLTAEQIRHLAIHGARQNDDGSFTWKFDNFVYSRFIAPTGLDLEESRALWSAITCPTLLVRGRDSWTADPALSGDTACFQNARCVNVEDAGHFVHHDQLGVFVDLARAFLAKRAFLTKNEP